MHRLNKFHRNGTDGGEFITHINFFKMASVRHVGFVCGNGILPTKCNFSFSYVVKFRLDPICSFEDVVIFRFRHFGLKLPIHARFPGLWGITHHLNPEMDFPSMGTRCVSHKAWKSVQRFELSAGLKKVKYFKDLATKLNTMLKIRHFQWSDFGRFLYAIKHIWYYYKRLTNLLLQFFRVRWLFPYLYPGPMSPLNLVQFGTRTPENHHWQNCPPPGKAGQEILFSHQ